MANGSEAMLDPEDHRKHLELIQSVIGRMSTASSLAKGWCLTIATAALGYALAHNSVGVGALAGFAICLFGFLDARYLREERKFRALYDDARTGGVAVYDMAAKCYGEQGHAKLAGNCAWSSVASSWSLLGFYGPLVAVTAAVVVRAAVN